MIVQNLAECSDATAGAEPPGKIAGDRSTVRQHQEKTLPTTQNACPVKGRRFALILPSVNAEQTVILILVLIHPLVRDLGKFLDVCIRELLASCKAD